MSPARQVLPALALLLVAACSPGGQIQLVLAPVLSSPEEVAGKVAEIQVVVSSADGLEGVRGSGRRPGGGTATDWDGDGDLDVVFATDHRGSDLPVLEIGVGENHDRPLEFRVVGFALDPATDSAVRPNAYGGASVTPGSSEVKRLGVPFDLRADARPPKVVLTLPPDGTVRVPPNLAAVTLVFSTTIDASTISAVRVTGPKGEVVVSRSLETVTLSKGSPLEESRSVLSLRFDGTLENGTHTVVLGPEVASTAGLHAQPFASGFVVSGGLMAPPECTCRQGYSCTAEGACKFDFTCAEGGSCAAGYACDDTISACVEDCRNLGLCPVTGSTCIASTGLCR